MSKILKLAVIAILLSFLAPETAGICKWVDENGVVHYAETCPEDAKTSEVHIHAPPSQEQIEATTRRSEESLRTTKARSEQKKLEKEQKALTRKTREESTDIMTGKCAEARWNLAILQKPLPVYFDEDNLLHFNRSLHDSWYGGQRTYLDDQQRQTEIMHYTRVEEQTCTASEAEIRERIKMYMEKSHREVCQHLKNKLENMKALSTGIPSDKMRDLEELIDTRCK